MKFPLVIIVEFGGGLALLLGFKTRWVAAVLALYSVAWPSLRTRYLHANRFQSQKELAKGVGSIHA
jgi:uncharacterized membrane protein YphA (DoxX/SURF4 family)